MGCYTNPIEIRSVQQRPKVIKQPATIPISKDHESNELGCHANPIIESSQIGSVQQRSKVNKQPSTIPISKDHSQTS